MQEVVGWGRAAAGGERGRGGCCRGGGSGGGRGEGHVGVPREEGGGQRGGQGVEESGSRHGDRHGQEPWRGQSQSRRCLVSRAGLVSVVVTDLVSECGCQRFIGHTVTNLLTQSG